jgi:hypothetical protein
MLRIADTHLHEWVVLQLECCLVAQLCQLPAPHLPACIPQPHPGRDVGGIMTQHTQRRTVRLLNDRRRYTWDTYTVSTRFRPQRSTEYSAEVDTLGLHVSVLWVPYGLKHMCMQQSLLHAPQVQCCVFGSLLMQILLSCVHYKGYE